MGDALKVLVTVTTAPRPVRTLEDSIQSLHASGITSAFDCEIYVSEDKGVGVSKHWLATLLQVVTREWDLLFMLQDDIVWAANAGKAVSRIAPRLSNFFTFYVDPKLDREIRWKAEGPKPGPYLSDLGRFSNGAQCYGFRPEFARRLASDEAFIRDMTMHNRGIDKRIPAACLAMGEPLQVWYPSIVSHRLGSGNSAIKPKPEKDTPCWAPDAKRLWR